ncbi:MAG: F0F1 ATP synthase subunit B [Chlorobi bacterium]|nr:F0F1 ATP synthase subunit B [Chlorobiota bacterium]
MDTLLNVNTGLLIWTIVTFLLVLYILSKIAWKPLLSGLEGREQRIREEVERAENARREAEKLLAKHKENLANAEREARHIIDEGRKTAEKIKDDIIREAREDAQRLVRQAQDDIRREKSTALNELRAEIADLAVRAAEKVINASLDDEKHRKLVNDFIDQLPRN